MEMLFRPVFTRAKTPVMESTPELQRNAFTDDNNDTDEGVTIRNRPRSTPRLPSFMSFRPATPPLPYSVIPGPEIFPNLRNSEDFYPKPSGDQLADTLKVVMMNQGAMDPVPIQYNSMILHLLEAYHDLRQQLKEKDEDLEHMKQDHTKDVMEMEDLTSKWDQKEVGYRAEIKRLEVLLSKTEGGLESVAMARTQSVIHGTEKALDPIRRGIGTIKARNSAGISRDDGFDGLSPVEKNIRGRSPTSLSPSSKPHFIIDTFIASSTIELRETRDWTTATRPVPHPARKRNPIEKQSKRNLQLPGPPKPQASKGSLQGSQHQPPSLTTSKSEAFALQQEEDCGVIFESSVSGSQSGSSSPPHSRVPARRKIQSVGLGIHEKPLPRVPATGSQVSKGTLELDGRKSSPETRTSMENVEGLEMGFSFRAGDDEDSLTRRSESDRGQIKTVDKLLDDALPSGLDLMDFGPKTSSSRAIEPARQPTPVTEPEAQASLATKPPQRSHLQHRDQELGRVDSSSSSVITAVRDSSGRSSTNNSQIGRPRLKRGTDHSGNSGSRGSGNRDAAAAAARAYAASHKRPSMENSVQGSVSGETRGDANAKHSVDSKCMLVDFD